MFQSVTDLSHEFSFYFDAGRFEARYLAPLEIANATNWGTLHKCDLRGVDLLILQSSSTPCSYTDSDIDAVQKFLHDGGRVLAVGGARGSEDSCPLNRLLRAFQAEFTSEHAIGTPRGFDGSPLNISAPASVLRYSSDSPATFLATDACGDPLAVMFGVGNGSIAVASRALLGTDPDKDDSINIPFWREVLSQLLAGKDAANGVVHCMPWPELEIDAHGLRIRTTEYLQDYADAIARECAHVFPRMERLMGISKPESMTNSIRLLPTSGGGFSTGTEIAIGLWWEGYPDRKYGMIELISHEAAHSWVLPHPEPLWNEGIATYVGIRVARDCGLNIEADRALSDYITAARVHDPQMDRFSLLTPNIPKEVALGKPIWMWSTLELKHKDLLSRYFRLRRDWLSGVSRDNYSAHDSIAILSCAAGENLFPWMLSLGIDVDPHRSQFYERIAHLCT